MSAISSINAAHNCAGDSVLAVRSRLFSTTILSGVGAAFLSSGTFAADIYTKAPAATMVPVQPAVDGLNWKFGGLGGTFADRTIGGAQGSLSIDRKSTRLNSSHE